MIIAMKCAILVFLDKKISPDFKTARLRTDSHAVNVDAGAVAVVL
jgi:hypothetical protein